MILMIATMPGTGGVVSPRTVCSVAGDSAGALTDPKSLGQRRQCRLMMWARAGVKRLDRYKAEPDRDY